MNRLIAPLAVRGRLLAVRFRNRQWGLGNQATRTEEWPFKMVTWSRLILCDVCRILPVHFRQGRHGPGGAEEPHSPDCRSEEGKTKISTFEFQELIWNRYLLCLCMPGFWPFVSGTGNEDPDGATSSLKWKRRTRATEFLPTASQKRVLSKRSTSMSGVPVLNCTV